METDKIYLKMDVLDFDPLHSIRSHYGIAFSVDTLDTNRNRASIWAAFRALEEMGITTL